ncbi:ABC transporter substrate-binding protein [Bogoriella caseilytica]|uniref:Multiple sugar transport system substrate-binding protein n=1 Tax=Bogoriella caseilytica TaxID=56055 RepID=A0A3N2BD21_9MICO|nr:sugar ABC transporter substrate-binding protein [Bogoriella caseilytica]ROR73147.1 multiple sugar transport system substrate-binding protein [Bogoriella caseilytica]
MNRVVQTNSRRRRATLVALPAALALVATACGSDSSAPENPDTGGEADAGGETVTIEFMQWWEPELPDGALRGLIEQFEAENEGIEVELLSSPYGTVRDQIVAGAAAQTMPDVLGVDGSWVHDFATQGSIGDLSAAMADADYDDSALAAQIQVDGATYMIPVVNFAYPMFVNNDILDAAGVEVPTTWDEFAETAQTVHEETGSAGFVTALTLERSNGVHIDVLPWMWASGGSMLTDDGGPAINNPEVAANVEFIKEMWDDGVLAPGGLTMAEQDKVEEFTNGRVAMMVSSLAHINLIRENNPDLDFSVVPMPVQEGYTGESGIRYASWGIGMAANTEHPEESWKLIEFLMSAEPNADLSGYANGFPGNSEATPDFSDADPLFEDAFEIWDAGYPVSEFTGLPMADELMRIFNEELQRILAEDKDIQDALDSVQEQWEEIL